MIPTNRPALGVNVDHVATIRQARGTAYPDPAEAAFLAESAGADQITIHLREDRRHIIDRDVRVMRQTVKTRLNLEMAATDEMLAIALEVRPDTVTLVPERREERTTEGGLDCANPSDILKKVTTALLEAGIPVSMFIDPNITQVDGAKALGAPIIELHTGDYADAAAKDVPQHLAAIREAAEHADAAGMTVAAGHGLTLRNVGPLCEIPEIVEYNIGHAIVARALYVGFEEAVREMIHALE